MNKTRFLAAYYKAVEMVEGGNSKNFFYAVELHPDTLASIRVGSPAFPGEYNSVAIEDPLMPVDRIAFLFCSREEWEKRWSAVLEERKGA